MKKHLYITFLFCLTIIPTPIFAWKHHNFDTAMKYTPHVKEKTIPITKSIVGIDEDSLYAFFKNRYNAINPSIVQPDHMPRIPKIMHQIWLGSKVPEAFEPFMASWIQMHKGPEWQYILWTDERIEKLGLYNQEFYDQTTNYGMKSDIARLEILYRFGGVYLDIDIEALAPLDILHHTYDFYIGLQPIDSGFIQVGNGIFGARPHHPVIQKAIIHIKDNWKILKGAPQKTGPVHITRMIYLFSKDEAESGLRDIILPALYFYPLGSQENTIQYEEWEKQGSLAVHWWAKSWMPKNYRKKKFQAIENDTSTKSWND